MKLGAQAGQEIEHCFGVPVRVELVDEFAGSILEA